MLKTIVKILLTVTFALSTAGCGGGDDGDSSTQDGDSQNSTTFTPSFSFSGDFIEQETVTATVTYTNSSESFDENSVLYEWRSASGVITTGMEITLVPSQIGEEIFLRASYTDSSGNSTWKDSDTYIVQNKPELRMFYESGGDYEVKHILSTDEGSTWSSESFVYRDLADDDDAAYTPKSATDGKGNIIVVWTSEYVDAFGGEYDVAYSYSHDNGATFSATALINPDDTSDSQSDEEPAIATDGSGNWVVVWSSAENLDGSGTDSDIVFAHSTDKGVSWSSPKLVNNYGSSDSSQDWQANIQIHGSTWVVVWMTAYDLNGGSNTDRDIVVSYSEDQGATWSTPLYINSWADSDSDTDYFPNFYSNDSGTAVVAWAGRNGESDLDVYAAVSSDFGKSWYNTTRINGYGSSDSASDHDYPRSVFVGSDNTIVVSWSGIGVDDGSDREAYYSVTNDLGNSWSSEVILNDTPDSIDEEFAAITQGPSGAWTACWVDASDNVYTKTSNDLIAWSSSQVVGDSDYSCHMLYH